MIATRELVERILRFDGFKRNAALLDPYDKMRLINRLLEFDVLLPCQKDIGIMPGVLRDTFARKIGSLERKDRLLIRALVLFAEEARKRQLRFVVLKGAPQAKRIYGSELMRSYSDVDILVAQEDLPKADYVARLSGFIQPAEYFAYRECFDALSPDEVGALQAPYMLRHRFDVAHLSPYVARVDGAWVGLEVHDRFFGVNPMEAAPFVWDTCMCLIGGIEVNVPTDTRMLAMLLLFAYEDSETYYSNATSGSLGLKIYLDLACAIEVYGIAALNKAFRLLSELGLDKICDIVLGNLVDLFPVFSDVNGLSGQSFGRFPCYTERLFDIGLRKEKAKCAFLCDLRGPEDEFVVKDGRSILFEWRREIAPEIACFIRMSSGFLQLEWTIPRCLVPDIAGFVFQVRAFPLFKCDVSEVMIDLFMRNGEVVCRARNSNHISRRKKASNDLSGVPCECVIRVSGHIEGADVCVSVPLSSLFGVRTDEGKSFVFDVGVFQHECGRLFHEKWSGAQKARSVGFGCLVDSNASM